MLCCLVQGAAHDVHAMLVVLCKLCLPVQDRVHAEHAALPATGCCACCARFAAWCRLLCMLHMPCCLTYTAVYAAHAVLPDARCRHILLLSEMSIAMQLAVTQ